MSRIPSSAMPHAKAAAPDGEEKQGKRASVKKQAGKIAEKARQNPKTAAAAGVAVVGAIAAAAIPLVRGAGKKSGEKKASAKKSSSKSESAKSESGSGGSKTKKS